MKVSVIVPIFNVQDYIANCVNRLLMQTLSEVEYIFVNDATRDNSMHILLDEIRKYPDKACLIKIIEHDCNMGLPSARNTGLQVATGDYVYHCDSDDYMEIDMLEKMYQCAVDANADYVWCDYYQEYDDSRRHIRQPSSKNVKEALQLMLSGKVKYNVWNKIVRRSLYLDNSIRFPDGYSMGEDMTMIRLLACANAVATVSSPLYHYMRSNTNAMTQKYSETHLKSLVINVNTTLTYLEKMGLASEIDCCLFKLSVKLPFLISNDWQSYRQWDKLYPEANAYILYSHVIPLRTRFLQLMAAKKFYSGVWLYNQIVYRFVYKVFYK